MPRSLNLNGRLAKLNTQAGSPLTDITIMPVPPSKPSMSRGSSSSFSKHAPLHSRSELELDSDCETGNALKDEGFELIGLGSPTYDMTLLWIEQEKYGSESMIENTRRDGDIHYSNTVQVRVDEKALGIVIVDFEEEEDHRSAKLLFGLEQGGSTRDLFDARSVSGSPRLAKGGTETSLFSATSHPFLLSNDAPTRLTFAALRKIDLKFQYERELYVDYYDAAQVQEWAPDLRELIVEMESHDDSLSHAIKLPEKSMPHQLAIEVSAVHSTHPSALMRRRIAKYHAQRQNALNRSYDQFPEFDEECNEIDDELLISMGEEDEELPDFRGLDTMWTDKDELFFFPGAASKDLEVGIQQIIAEADTSQLANLSSPHVSYTAYIPAKMATPTYGYTFILDESDNGEEDDTLGSTAASDSSSSSGIDSALEYYLSPLPGLGGEYDVHEHAEEEKSEEQKQSVWNQSEQAVEAAWKIHEDDCGEDENALFMHVSTAELEAEEISAVSLPARHKHVAFFRRDEGRQIGYTAPDTLLKSSLPAHLTPFTFFSPKKGEQVGYTALNTILQNVDVAEERLAPLTALMRSSRGFLLTCEDKDPVIGYTTPGFICSGTKASSIREEFVRFDGLSRQQADPASISQMPLLSLPKTDECLPRVSVPELRVKSGQPTTTAMSTATLAMGETKKLTWPKRHQRHSRTRAPNRRTERIATCGFEVINPRHPDERRRLRVVNKPRKWCPAVGVIWEEKEEGEAVVPKDGSELIVQSLHVRNPHFMDDEISTLSPSTEPVLPPPAHENAHVQYPCSARSSLWSQYSHSCVPALLQTKTS